MEENLPFEEERNPILWQEARQDEQLYGLLQRRKELRESAASAINPDLTPEAAQKRIIEFRNEKRELNKQIRLRGIFLDHPDLEGQ